MEGEVVGHWNWKGLFRVKIVKAQEIKANIHKRFHQSQMETTEQASRKACQLPFWRFRSRMCWEEKANKKPQKQKQTQFKSWQPPFI